MGKSFVRNAIMEASAADNRYNLKTAFNHINAAEMKAPTTAYLIALNVQYHMVRFGNYRPEVMQQLKNDGFDIRGMVFIEEVSTQAPWHVAQLCRLCQQINENYLEYLGGEVCKFYW